MNFNVPIMTKTEALHKSTRQFIAAVTKINKDTNSLNLAEVRPTNFIHKKQSDDTYYFRGSTLQIPQTVMTHYNVPIKILTDLAYFKFKQSGLALPKWLEDNDPYEDAWTIFLACSATALLTKDSISVGLAFTNDGEQEYDDPKGTDITFYADCIETENSVMVVGVHQNWWSKVFASCNAYRHNTFTYIEDRVPFYKSGRVMPVFDLFAVFNLLASSYNQTIDPYNPDAYTVVDGTSIPLVNSNNSILLRLKDKRIFSGSGYFRNPELIDLIEGSFIVSLNTRKYYGYNVTPPSSYKCYYPPTAFPSIWGSGGAVLETFATDWSYVDIAVSTRDYTLHCALNSFIKLGGRPFLSGAISAFGTIIQGQPAEDIGRSLELVGSPSWTFYEDVSIDCVVNIDSINCFDDRTQYPNLNYKTLIHNSLEIKIYDEKNPSGAFVPGLNDAIVDGCVKALLDAGGASNPEFFYPNALSSIIAKPRFKRGTYFGEAFDYADGVI